MTEGRFNPMESIKVRWEHYVTVAVDHLILLQPIGDVRAGDAVSEVIVGVQGRCGTTGCVAKESVDRSVRPVKVEVLEVPLPGRAPRNVTLNGTTTVQAIRGMARFTDLRLETIGNFYLRFTSDTVASSVAPLESPTFKTSAGEARVFEIVSSLGGSGERRLLSTTNGQFRASTPHCEPIILELKDEFGNLVDCEFGECPTTKYGYGCQPQLYSRFNHVMD